MATTSLNDSGTWRDVSPYINDSGTWRTIIEVWLNDSGTWRQIFGVTYRLDDAIFAGTDGTYTGYSVGGYTGAGSFGSIGVSNSISGGGTLDFIGDLAGSAFIVAIAIGADPGAGYVTDVLVDSVSANTTIGASPSYVGYSGGYAVWVWPAALGITNGVPYGIQIVP